MKALTSGLGGYGGMRPNHVGSDRVEPAVSPPCTAAPDEQDGADVDWSRTRTTPDQLSIERVLESEDLVGKRILHVGAGNSGLARRFASRVDHIDALTVSQEEVACGNCLELPGYAIHLRNKYRPGLCQQLGQQYDIIVDNNIGSYACCGAHLRGLMNEYRRLLRMTGYILTDRRGMDWKASPAGIRLRPLAMAMLARAAGLRLSILTDTVYRLDLALPQKDGRRKVLSSCATTPVRPLSTIQQCQ
jgi:hypothetical protein